MMQLEFFDLAFAHVDSLSMGILFVAQFIFLMQLTLTAWGMHLHPDELRALRLP